MPVAPLAGALGFIGRQGAWAVAASVFVGIAVPPLASLSRPLLTEALLVLLALAFLRVEPAAIRAEAARPKLLIAAALWITVAVPIAFGALIMALAAIFGAGVSFGLVLNIIAPPVFSTPALVALVGIDPALALATVIACAALTPVTASVFAAVFLGPALPLSPIGLGLRLLALLGAAALAAALIRGVAGRTWIDRQRERIDGLNVVALFVFGLAAMDGVTGHLLAEPALAAGILLLAFAMTLALMASTALVFHRCKRQDAIALALASAGRNMGLLMAATGGAVPDLAWLYFALAQIPIYLLPLLLRPLAANRAAP